MKNWKKVIGVASAAAMTAAMMMPASVFAADDETFKIGVIGPMTGDYAQYGTNVYNAARSQQMRSTRTADSTDIKLKSLTQVMTREIRRRLLTHTMT